MVHILQAGLGVQAFHLRAHLFTDVTHVANRSDMKKILLIGLIFIVVGLAAYFFYPKLILETYGKKIPEKWIMNYGELKMLEIKSHLGAPQEELLAKDYQNWNESHWWGIKQLKIINSSNGVDAPPGKVIYLVYVNGWYGAKYKQDLL
jgi:hypothetical protein